jgi:hypothetical protein
MPSGAALPEDVPAELRAMVDEFTRHMNKHLAEAVQIGRRYAACRGEWQRLVLYALTDALAYNYRPSARSPPTCSNEASMRTCCGATSKAPPQTGMSPRRHSTTLPA